MGKQIRTKAMVLLIGRGEQKNEDIGAGATTLRGQDVGAAAIVRRTNGWRNSGLSIEW
jgi:hypothetical protein